MSALRVTETIFAFGVIVLMVLLLKRKKILTANDLGSYSDLMITFVLPAVIFLQLSLHPVTGHQFIMVSIMLMTGLVSLIIAWIAGVLMHLKRDTLGMFLMVSTFGSSAVIGYPLIQFVFPENPLAMADAISISELGVGIPIFTLCPLVAAYYGSGSKGYGIALKTILNYLRSPIFLALVAGIVFSRFQDIVQHPFLQPVWEALRMIQGMLTVVACMILALQLKFKSLRKILPLFVISVIIQLGIQPFLAGLGADMMNIGSLGRQVLILISATPSAVLCAVFATRYNCDPESASELVFMNIMMSIVGIPLVYFSIFGSL